MELNEECKGCLYNSQMKKVEGSQSDKDKLQRFRDGVRALCDNPPPHYCAPLLMRDIDGLHRGIFGTGIDYSREKSMFNRAMLALEEGLYAKICAAPDPVCEALKLAISANFIDFARTADLDGSAVDYVLASAAKAQPDKATLGSFKKKLETAKKLCVLHDNCGELVLDKILIRVIKDEYPRVRVLSVVRGKPIINDATEADASEVGLGEYAEVIGNGSDVPATYLKEVSPRVLRELEEADVVLSKGLGNLETLYGEGYDIFYAFVCKCGHISRSFGAPLASAVFARE